MLVGRFVDVSVAGCTGVSVGGSSVFVGGLGVFVRVFVGVFVAVYVGVFVIVGVTSASHDCISHRKANTRSTTSESMLRNLQKRFINKSSPRSFDQRKSRMSL